MSNAENDPGFGDCYEAAIRSAEVLAEIKASVESDAPDASEHAAMYENRGLSETIEVVHGTAVIPEGPHAGRTTGHAWIEIGQLAFETSNGQVGVYPKDQFYTFYGIRPEVRYSPTEARALADVHGHYGPWHSPP